MFSSLLVLKKDTDSEGPRREQTETKALRMNLKQPQRGRQTDRDTFRETLLSGTFLGLLRATQGHGERERERDTGTNDETDIQTDRERSER